MRRRGISHSTWRKLVVTLIIVVGFVLLYQATILDSRYAARQALLREETADAGIGARMRFTATAYCSGVVTASGVNVQTGIAAADPAVLPVGSVIQVSRAGQWNGIYTVMDTGPVVKGRRVDIYTRDCGDAVRFGRRSVQVFVLRLGWNPRAQGSSLLDTLMPWRERQGTPKAVPKSKPTSELPQFPGNR